MNEKRKGVTGVDLIWNNAIFLTAVSEWAEYVQDSDLIAWYNNIALRNNYQVNCDPHVYHADNLIIGMLYANIYDKTGDEHVLHTMLSRLEFIAKHPSQNTLVTNDDDLTYKFKYRWSWCDALYMAPQVFARYAKIFDEPELLDLMDTEYWATTDFLYNPEYHLYYRDSKYFNLSEKNGMPVFWGRGNAWVVAGLAHMLPYLPKDYPSYPRYVQLYKDMMKAIVSQQNPAGHWCVSMLDAENYPTPEMSSTSFFAYAIWWGINQGLLDKAIYLEPATRAWQAMVRAVRPTGMLGNVQAVGEKPESITKDMTEVYGPAAMAFTAQEILKYIKK